MPATVRELEARLIQATSAVDCLAALVELAELHAATHRNREGLRCAREALNIARARGDTRSAARALAASARCHFQRGDPLAAAAAAFDAIRAFGEKDAGGRSAALRGLAGALAAVESLELAQAMAERATADAVKARDAAGEASARFVMGSILAQRGRHEEARRKFREAGALQRRLEDVPGLKRCAMHIGHGYRSQGNEAMGRGEPERARVLWRQAVRVYRVALGCGVSATEDATALAAVAECECRMGDPQAALDAVRQAVESAAASASPEVVARRHLWESHALKALGRLESARRAAECARNAAEQLDHDILLAECLKAESALNDLAGRFETAQDLELRAERVLLERSAFFSRVREDVNALIARHAEEVPAFLRAVA